MPTDYEPETTVNSEPRNVADETFESYVADQPVEARAMLEELRQIIKSVAPDAIEGFSYRMPVFKQNGTLAWIGGFKGHCSLFGLGVDLMDSFGDELKGYRTSKGTLQFAIDEPLPVDLIKKLLKARLAANETRRTTKGRKNAKA